jgi:hypothetical protein
MQWNMADNVFENNIIYAGARCLISLNKSQADKNQSSVTIDHNVYYCAAGPQKSAWAGASSTITGFDPYLAATGNDRHSQFADPRFVDPAKSDFHLQSDSPALAAGAADVGAGEVDLDGLPRVKSGKIDAGCYQRQ